MEHLTKLFLVIFLFLFFNQSTLSNASDSKITYINVISLGAKPDGKTDSTAALTSAWAATCNSSEPASIFVPKGRFLVNQQAEFSGPCKNRAITLRIDGSIIAPSDYNVLGSATFWLEFKSVDGVTIRGGILDGKGADLWACKASSGKSCPTGISTLGFSNSNNIILYGLTSLNSQLFHIVFNGCTNVTLQGVKVTAAGNSPNTDGIHIQFSSGVEVLNSKLSTGDDCVSIGPGTSNLSIQNVICGPGHGISIGSLGRDSEEEGVQNVTVQGVKFINTQNGVRIKSWGRPSKGFVNHVVFQHITMINVQNPIVIDQNYCPDNTNCPGQVSGVQINDVKYQDVHGTSATEVAVKFDCSKKYPCKGITLEDVKLKYKNQQAKSVCANAGGDSIGLIEPSSCLL